MCYCDTHFFTINRADEFMVARRDGNGDIVDPIYVIDPDTLIAIIDEMVASGMIEVAIDKSEWREKLEILDSGELELVPHFNLGGRFARVKMPCH